MAYGLGIYLLWNLVTMAVVGLDKFKARHNQWRVRESTLLGLAFAMGGVGVFIGMQLFRHKTQHVKFKVGVPLFIGLNIATVILTWRYVV
ncbi:DUF1294 domain-containing protein [Paradesulfitobacterium aromaticivorans]